MRRSYSAMTRDVDGEAVILDVASGRYFGLDNVGALIWTCLEQDQTRGDLVAAVTAQYDVDAETAGADIDDLLAELVDRGLVVE